ncbi:MAG TPA: NIL domain-containing protein [Longimicrobiales bacterium]|jgi:ABC-type methionine transport system ATPase subunit
MASARFHLTLPGALRDEPVIASLAGRFGLQVNIGRARIEEDSGWAIVDMKGDAGKLTEAERWLSERGVTVERIDT